MSNPQIIFLVGCLGCLLLVLMSAYKHVATIIKYRKEWLFHQKDLKEAEWVVRCNKEIRSFGTFFGTWGTIAVTAIVFMSLFSLMKPGSANGLMVLFMAPLALVKGIAIGIFIGAFAAALAWLWIKKSPVWAFLLTPPVVIPAYLYFTNMPQ